MTPFTPEQIEALAERIEAMVEEAPWPESGVLWRLAKDIRDGTFIEVQHD